MAVNNQHCALVIMLHFSGRYAINKRNENFFHDPVESLGFHIALPCVTAFNI